jgi:hypothetical protein
VNFFNIKVVEKGLSDPGWRILPFHKLYIPRIAELTWEFCHPTASYANKIYILQFGLAYMSWVRGCLATMIADVGFIYIYWIAQVTKLFRCLAAGLAHVNFFSHDFLPSQSH